MEAGASSSNLRIMNQEFVKLDKFDGCNYTRWADKMKFLLIVLKIFYVLDPLLAPIPANPVASEGQEVDPNKVLKLEKQRKMRPYVVGLKSASIRRIQWLGYGLLEFLGVGTTFDIFRNILFPYSLNTAYCLFWIRRIGLVSFVVFGECRHGYAVSSLMDTAYWLSE
ncbi:hypothetical protein Tco_0500056 [Tanacetum coccineum]